MSIPTHIAQLGILVAFLTVTVGLVAAAAYDPHSATAVFRDKHMRLASLPSPKVVLIGGSNLTYGLDSAQLERDLHLPVVNTAYSAGFGLRFQLDDTLSGIHRGDIAVIIPAYEQFQSSLVNGTGDILNILFYHPSSVLAIKSWKQVFKIVEYIPTFLQTNLKKHILSPLVQGLFKRQANGGLIYTRTDFNQQGDLVGYLRHPPAKKVAFKPLPAEAVNPEAIRVLNRFFDQATERGARVVLLFPPYGSQAYVQGRAVISDIENALRKQTRLDIPSKPEDFVFSENEFFDSYHLYVSGRAQRTKLVMQFLSKVLNAPSSVLQPDKNR